MFRPNINQFTTPVRVQHRTETNINGAIKESYSDADDPLCACAWKGKGGTESVKSGVQIVEDTAEVTMWYRPDISEKDRLLLHNNDKLAYDVINAEDVEQRHQYLILKVRRAVKP